jgi:hypothetical protein
MNKEKEMNFEIVKKKEKTIRRETGMKKEHEMKIKPDIRKKQ